MSQVAAVEHVAEKLGSTVFSEALDESLGISSKKWALVLLAFLAGAALAVWIAARRQTRSHQALTAVASEQVPRSTVTT